MFSQWFLFICSFICVSGTGDSQNAAVVEKEESFRDTSGSIVASSHYGWQVSASTASLFDVPAN
jgi:hypothetical protein